MNDFLDPYKTNPSDAIPFCGKDSIICSSVADTIDSSRAFCERMGFKVQSFDDVKQSGKGCYEGIPSKLKAQRGAKAPPSPE